VDKECKQLHQPRSDFRFSRRSVRQATGWGNTQLKLHLGRLEEMEYLLTHRGKRGQCFVYELLYEGQGQDGKPFMVGLIDVEKLRAEGPAEGYDAEQSGAKAEKSAPGRAEAGDQSGSGRGDGNTAMPRENRAILPDSPPEPPNTRLGDTPPLAS
jgi:hypothetical protein